jgi:hypothetical protein
MQVTGRESTFALPTDAEPASVVLDPGVWLLAALGPFQKAVERSGQMPSPTSCAA